jgi:peroxiredoxin
MNKYIALILAIGFLFFSCSKKNDTATTQKDTPKQNNTQSTGQQQTGATPSYKVTNVGNAGKNEMVDFTWNENGKDVKLSDYKGKVILVNFWATWCPPCKKELPSLSAIASEFKNKDFKMVGVSVDDNQSVLNTYLQSNSLSYTIVHEPDQLVQKYMDVTGQRDNVIPQSYIIDKSGKVVEVVIGARSKADFISLINKYL